MTERARYCGAAWLAAMACVLALAVGRFALGNDHAGPVIPRWPVVDKPGEVTASESRRHMEAYLSWPDVWNRGLIVLAKVGSAKSLDGCDVRGFVALDIVADFNDPPAPVRLVCPSGFLQQVTGAATWAMPVKPGDVVLARIGTRQGSGPEGIYGIAVADDERGRWVESLKLIQAYRITGKEGRAAAGEAILASGNNMAMLYLGRDCAMASREAPKTWETLLLKARDNENHSVTVRLFMSEILHRSFVGYRKDMSHVQWIRRWFAAPRELTSQETDDLLSQLRTYAAPESLWETDVPAAMALLGSPKTTATEASSILRWVRVLIDGNTGGQARDKTIVSLVESAFAPISKDRRLDVLEGASAVIWSLSIEVKNTKTSTATAPGQAPSNANVLRECEEILRANMDNTRNWDELKTVRAMLEHIKAALDQTE